MANSRREFTLAKSTFSERSVVYAMYSGVVRQWCQIGIVMEAVGRSAVVGRTRGTEETCSKYRVLSGLLAVEPSLKDRKSIVKK